MISPIEDIIADIKQGKMVVFMDDEDRENEGDLFVAAEKITAEHINFMVTHARGLTCLPMTKQRCEQLNIPLMVSSNGGKFGTNFTVSIEAAQGVTTGISAQDRAKTVLAAVNTEAKPQDIVSPGHIFPIMAHCGGVLARAGHTEAIVDLARLAGLEPAGVICEILNQDGTMARRPQLEQFAKQHNLKIGTIASLIQYRFCRETSVKSLGSYPFPTSYGNFKLEVFQDDINKRVHLALVKGDLSASDSTWVRVHRSCPLFDIPGYKDPMQSTWPLAGAMEFIAANNGVILMLQEELSGDSILAQLGIISDVGESEAQPRQETDLRVTGVGSQILSALGVGNIKLLGSEKKYCGLSGFGLKVVEYLPYKSGIAKRSK